jgi:hypothetical protein
MQDDTSASPVHPAVGEPLPVALVQQADGYEAASRRKMSVYTSGLGRR